MSTHRWITNKIDIPAQRESTGVRQVDYCTRCGLHRQWLTPAEDTGNGVRYVFPDGTSVGGRGEVAQMPPCEPEHSTVAIAA